MESIMDIGLLDVSQAEFYNTTGGFVGLRYKGEDYPHIVLRRCLPMQQPFNYISVAFPIDNDKDEEIGILKAVDDLSSSQREIIMTELDNRYYSPEVLDVISVHDKLGYVWFNLQLKTKTGAELRKDCFVKDVSRNIRMLSENSVIIFDVDGNRYIVNDLSRLNQKALRKLDAYLF